MIDSDVVGRNIAYLRRSRQLTQQVLAAELNVTHQAVSKWERGESLPDLESLYHLSNFFRIAMDDIVKKEVEMEETTNPSTEPSAAQRNDTLLNNTLYLSQENMNEIWKRVLLIASRKINYHSFFVWLKPTSAILEDGTIIVYTKNQYQADWLMAKYHHFVKGVLEEVTGERDLKIEYVVSERCESYIGITTV